MYECYEVTICESRDCSECENCMEFEEAFEKQYEEYKKKVEEEERKRAIEDGITIKELKEMLEEVKGEIEKFKDWAMDDFIVKHGYFKIEEYMRELGTDEIYISMIGTCENIEKTIKYKEEAEAEKCPLCDCTECEFMWNFEVCGMEEKE